MKKLFTILTVVAISTTFSFAQQGKVAIGVGSNLANVSWQDYQLIPTVGYFISDVFMVGTGFATGSTSSEEGDYEFESGGMTLSPFVRMYINESLYASAGIAIGSNYYSEDYDDGFDIIKRDDETSSFGFNASIGYSLMWNDRVCIEPSLGIASEGGSTIDKVNYNGIVTETDTDAPSTFGMAIGLGIHIRLGGE